MADNIDTRFDVMVTGLAQYERYVQVTERAAAAQLAMLNATQQMNAAGVRITNTYTSFDKAGNKLTRSTTHLNNALVASSQHYDTTTRAVQGTTREAKKFGITWQGVQRIVVGSVIARAIGKVMMAMSEGFQSADEYLLRLGEIRTISQDMPLVFDKWSESVRNLSDAWGTDILETAEGHYQTLSNQIAKGSEVTRFMADAQAFALISVANTSDAVNLLTGAMNAYNMEAEDAWKVSQSFFKTIELGRLRASDLAGSFGSIAILGSQLSIELNELNASLATLTIKGVPPAVAMTFLRGVLLKLIRPTDHMKTIFQEWGVASGAAAIETFGFVGVLRKLAERAEASGDMLTEIGEAFGRIRAIVGATGLIGSFDKFEYNLQQIEAGGKAADAALEEMLDNVGFRIRREVQQIKNFFLVDFAVPILEAIDFVNTGFIDLSDTVTTVFAVAAQAAGIIAVASLFNVLTSVRALDAAFFAIAGHPLIIAFMSGFFVTSLILKLTEAREAVDALNVKMTDGFIEESDKRIKAHEKETRAIVKGTSDQVTEQISELNSLFTFLTIEYNKIIGYITVQRDIDKEIFDRRVALLGPTGKFAALLAEIGRQQTAYNAALKLADSKEEYVAAAKSLKEIEKLIKRIGDIDANVAIGRSPTGVSLDQPMVSAKAYAAFMQKNMLPLWEELGAAAKTVGDVTGVNPENLQQQFEAAVKVKDSFIAINEELQDQIAAHEKQSGQFDEMVTKANQMRVALSAAQASVKELFKPRDTPGTGMTGGPVIGPDPAALQAAKNLDEARALVQRLLELGAERTDAQTNGMLVAAAELGVAIEAMQEIGLKGAPTDFLLELEQFKFAVQTIANAEIQLDASAEALKLIEKKYEGVTDSIDAVKRGFYNLNVANQLGLQTNMDHATFLQQVMPAIQVDMEAAVARMTYLIQQAQQLRRERAQGKVTGGYMSRFASGGSVGSDTILARLSPGEFVSDRAATRRLLPKLVANNSRSLRMASGGIVNNIGDVNVSLTTSAVTSDGTARQMGNALRRELQRGNVRLS